MRSVRGGAAALAVLLVLGCSEGDEAGPGSSAPRSTGAPSSADSARSTAEAAAETSSGEDPTREDGYAGAEAAIEEFIRAEVALDQERMHALAAPDCNGCEDHVEQLQEARAKGLQRFELHGELEISMSWDWPFGSEPEENIAYVQVELPEIDVVTGPESLTAPPTQLTTQATVARQGDQWLVASIGELLSSDEAGATATPDAAASPSATDPGYYPQGATEVSLPALAEELPADLREHSAQGAMSTAAYTAELLQTRSLVLPDQAALLTPECQSCGPAVAYLEDLRDDGYRLEAEAGAYPGSERLVHNVSPHAGATDDESVWTVSLDTPFTSVVDQTGQVVTSWPMEQMSMDVSVYWDDEAGHWRVREISEAVTTP